MIVEAIDMTEMKYWTFTQLDALFYVNTFEAQYHALMKGIVTKKGICGDVVTIIMIVWIRLLSPPKAAFDNVWLSMLWLLEPKKDFIPFKVFK